MFSETENNNDNILLKTPLLNKKGYIYMVKISFPHVLTLPGRSVKFRYALLLLVTAE